MPDQDKSSTNEDTESLADIRRRIDPSGDLAKMQPLIDAASNPIVRVFLRLLNVGPEHIGELESSASALETHIADVDLIANTLPTLGWGVFSGIPHDAYSQAAHLAAAGKPDEAEALLVETWNNPPDRLQWSIQKIKALGHGSDEWRTIYMRRWELLEYARKLHVEGNYYASIPIVLAQIDGITYDITGNNGMGFYDSNPKRLEHLKDTQTLAGANDGLLAVASLFSQPFRRTRSVTEPTGSVDRHAIMHGRSLGYDTLDTSTKAFVALLTLLEWAAPVMSDRIAREQQDYIDRWTGSKELDDDGRRFDRRGFDDAQEALRKVETFQDTYRTKHGRYAATVDELLPGGGAEMLDTPRDMRITTPDTDRFYATVETTTGYVFGIAADVNDRFVHRYAGETQPEVGPGESDAWVHDTEGTPTEWW